MIRHSLRISISGRLQQQQQRLGLLGARHVLPVLSRSLHEGRTVLDVGLGENDHVLQVGWAKILWLGLLLFYAVTSSGMLTCFMRVQNSCCTSTRRLRMNPNCQLCIHDTPDVDHSDALPLPGCLFSSLQLVLTANGIAIMGDAAQCSCFVICHLILYQFRSVW